MKNFVKNPNLSIYILIIVIISIISFYFYWYQYRPAKARSYCSEIALISAKREYHSAEWNTKFRPEDYKNYYSLCLNSKGIK